MLIRSIRYIRVPLACLFFLLSSCTIRPWSVLSDTKMENVLYDLYLAETEIAENPSVFANDSAKRADLLHSVFKKHGISEQKLDSSLVWYNAHLNKYMEINKKLTERYDRLIKSYQDEQKRITDARTRIDTTWFYREEPFCLTSKFNNHIHPFVANLDSGRPRRSEPMTLSFLAVGVSETEKPALTFCIQCSDSNYVFRDTVETSGYFNKEYKILGHTIQSIYGHISLPDSCLRPILIAGTELYQTRKWMLPADSVKPLSDDEIIRRSRSVE